MSNPTIKPHHPSRMLTVNAGLRAFLLVLCCLAGASGFATGDQRFVDSSLTKDAFPMQGAPALPDQEQTAGAGNNVNLLSRLWRPQQARLFTFSFSNGDGNESTADIAVNTASPHGGISSVAAQGYAPGTHTRVPSFYSLTGTPRAPPLTS
ncbi:hypothetical protein [Pseudohongiella acticola]|uniref:hypothetical protein n=1 Tax=Pseudohongiella acticola TaxID=1524254 RepID=UPI0030EF3E69